MVLRGVLIALLLLVGAPAEAKHGHSHHRKGSHHHKRSSHKHRSHHRKHH
jgi:hypothetical protein